MAALGQLCPTAASGSRGSGASAAAGTSRELLPVTASRWDGAEPLPPRWGVRGLWALLCCFPSGSGSCREQTTTAGGSGRKRGLLERGGCAAGHGLAVSISTRVCTETDQGVRGQLRLGSVHSSLGRMPLAARRALCPVGKHFPGCLREGKEPAAAGTCICIFSPCPSQHTLPVGTVCGVAGHTQTPLPVP